MNQEMVEVIGISLGLGLLVGLQREHANARIGGIRTFPLITLFGTLCGLLAKEFGGVLLAAGLLSITGMVLISNWVRKEENSGKTTEAAILLMYSVGAFLAVGDKTISVSVAAITTVLLHFKNPMHKLVQRFGYKELKVMMQFVLVSMVILPILPNQDFGPYQALNLQEIWLMVVLIVGLSVIGYFTYTFLGSQTGTLLSGLLGGLASSTATTVSFAKHTKKTPALVRPAVFVILSASAVSFVRMIVEIGVVSPAYLIRLALPLGAVLLLMGILSALVYTWKEKADQGERMNEALLQQDNPAQLKSALIFGVIYGLVVLGTAAANDVLGNQGLYGVAILSGLTSVDAITLSTAKMVNLKSMEAATGWKVILVAALANLVFKGGVVAVLGDRRLFRQIALWFGICLAGGLLVVFLWPDTLLVA
jgi:uncharacterized membrane protein (DUF4010 family)